MHTPPIAVPLCVWLEAFSAAPCMCTYILLHCIAVLYRSQSGDPFSSTMYMCLPVHLPSVASQHGALSCLVSSLFSIALSLRLPLSQHHIMPSQGPFWQCLQYVLPCTILQHHAILVPTSTKCTVSVELSRVAEGATATKLKALECWVGGNDGSSKGYTSQHASGQVGG